MRGKTMTHNVYSIYRQDAPLNSLVRQAIRLYPHHPYTHRHTVNRLRRGWIVAVQFLGEKWILHPAHRAQRGVANPDTLVFLAAVAAFIVAHIMGVSQ